MNDRVRGFSLLEVLIVILVIGLALSLVYPSVARGAKTLQLRTAGRDVLNVFRYAREKAVTEQTGMKVTLNPSKQELFMTNNLGDQRRSYTLPRDITIEHMRFAGTEITSGPMTVRFLPNGSTEDAAVMLKSESGASLLIVTDPMTGGARIESNKGGRPR
jgi:general secretion pathway protein H